RLCHIMSLRRPGYSLLEYPEESECEKEYYDSNKTDDFKILANTSNGKIYLSDLDEIDVSSTKIRKTISEGQQPKYLLPGNVWNYIHRNKLYK
ncbi:MAG: hypothetical protein OEQ24_00005, partial [Gammaproteobacteria bacterium]|nr:hypothetical protein [Gammaproteobacteria bacterium]